MEMEIAPNIQSILDNLPLKPGCYIMKGSDGTVIYVGKAINLRNRVRSYFHKLAEWDHKTRKLVPNVTDIEWIVVGSELEALILEMNLIKKHRPRYNVRLKDDKKYPYIKVHWMDDFPEGYHHPRDGKGWQPLFRSLHFRLGCASNHGSAAAHFPVLNL